MPTALTVQNTQGVKHYTAVDSDLITQQIETLEQDFHIAAVKLGMLGDSKNADVIIDWYQRHKQIPLIVDPVLASNQGDALSDDTLIDVYRHSVLPLTTLLTPNVLELDRLTRGNKDEAAAVAELCQLGCRYVLLTGTHRDTEHVENRLYDNNGVVENITVERLPAEYHGAGCTLASACAATLAHGLDPVHAVAEAIDFTWQSLKHGYHIGQGQTLPNRLYWTAADEDDD